MTTPVEAQAETRTTKVIDSLVKSHSDRREYRALVLPNELQVLLISDVDTDKAAAALSVAAGAMNDPFELQGLAHFLEHMLFLGTAKYPDESGFDIYLRQHAGMSNAYTDRDHTNYFFDVSPESFSPALDRFAQFFVCPLFNEDSTERELNAVDSENSKNVPHDGRRTIRVENYTSNPKHAYSKFTTGNRISLWTRPKERSIDTREALLTFYNQFYSSNVMNLAVLGKESLDELQVLVESLFSSVVNKRAEKPFWNESPYTPNELQVRINIVPIKELRQIFIKFPVPYTLHLHKSCPMNYISHLVGHEGPGSLLSLLKSKGWVNELSAGGTFPGRGFGIFNIHCQLSMEGWLKLDDIVLHIFQYLEMLRRAGPLAYIWEELREINGIRFRFQDKSAPAVWTRALAAKMQQYPLEEVISAGHILTEFQPDVISEILECLTPDRCRIITNSKLNEEAATLSEEWYGAKYSLEKLDPALIKMWTTCGVNEGLALPQKNEFIPTLFDIKPRETTASAPEVIVNTKYCTAWHHHDSEFLLPKTDIKIEFYSPLPKISPDYYTLTQLLKAGVNDLFQESTYAASLAGYKFDIRAHMYGIEVEFSGYDHKIGLVLDSVIDKILNFSCTPARFEIIKDQLERSLKNFRDEEPRVHADWYMGHLLSQVSWTQEELLEALKDITLESLVSFATLFVSRLKMEWLVHGNITQSEAKNLITKCQNLFESKGIAALAPEDLERIREVRLPAGSDLIFRRENSSHTNSCAAVFFQAGTQNYRDCVLVDLLIQVTRQPCFTQLRTKEQLGYIVWAKSRRANGTHGFEILVQSAYHPEYVESRIDCFLHTVETTLNEMTEEEFKLHSQSLKVIFSQRHKTLSQRSAHYWNEIFDRVYLFDRKSVQLQLLETITREELAGFFKKLIGPPVSEKGRLGVHVLSTNEEGANHKEVKGPLPIEPKVCRTPNYIEDALSWKSTQAFHSHPEPAMRLPQVVDTQT